MKIIISLILLLIGMFVKAQDSTLSEVRSPAYHAGRALIIKGFKPIRDSIVATNPKWKDSVAVYTKLIFTKIDSVTKREYIDRLNYSQQKYDVLINMLRMRWCPFGNQLIIYNRKWHVVGDMRAHCEYYND